MRRVGAGVVCVCLVVGVLVPPGRQVINHGQEQAGPALTQSTSRTNTETTPQSLHWCSASWWWCWWFWWLYSICVWKVSFVSVSFMPGPGPGQTSPDHKSNVRRKSGRDILLINWTFFFRREWGYHYIALHCNQVWTSVVCDTGTRSPPPWVYHCPVQPNLSPCQNVNKSNNPCSRHTQYLVLIHYLHIGGSAQF